MRIDNNKYTILFITAISPDAIRIIRSLEDEKFTVRIAEDEQAAIRQAQQTDVELILLNPQTSAPNEYTVIQLLRRSHATRNVPIIFLAPISNEELISECLNYKAMDFITEPLREKELLLRVRHQLSLFEAQRTIRKQEERLKKTIESRDQLYSVIAHDLRSPIGTIKMINSIIENEKDKIRNARIRKYFDMISTTTEQAFNLLENLLRWSRNQNGKTKVVATAFDLAAAVRQVSDLFTTIAKAKNITLENQIKVPQSVYADEDMIKTVLRNLLSNAIKFTYSGGHIILGSTEDSDSLTVSVKDNGQGIKKENQSKILKANLSTQGTQKEKGSGLGLLLCRDFVRMNKGKLWFSSQENKGTTFYFSIPRTPSGERLSLPG